MSTLNDTEKLKYINTNFHQYFDFKINKDFVTTERINLVVPIDSLNKISNVNDILNKYTDTTIEKEKVVYCTRVIDGDTIWVRDVIDYEINDDETKTIKTFSSLDNYTREEILLGDPYKVRFVGIDTPEVTLDIPTPDTRTEAQKAADEASLKKAKIATNFVEKLCLRQFIHLNIDSEYINNNGEIGKDLYGRTLAVVIVQNKNLNEVLLKENFAQVDVLEGTPSEFTPSDWEDNSAQESSFNEKSEDISVLSPYFRSDMKNIVFTATNNTNFLYPYEVYQGVIYIKVYPYNQNIRMHILPKAYDCSNEGSVLILKDSDIKRRVVDYSNNYKVYPDKDNINAYFQVNGEDRDRTTITNKNYNKESWSEDSLGRSKTFVDYTYKISDLTKSINKLQICTGYRYNNTSPFYALHYTGAKESTGRPEDRCTLIDANVDKVKTKTDIITQMMYNDNATPDNTNDDKIYLKHSPDVRKELGTFDHTTNVGVLHRKILKYINDTLYVEEGAVSGIQEWIDRKQEEMEGN